MTGLPASVLGLKDRGIVKNNYWADLVIFNPNNIIDNATWEDPHLYPSGIDLVIINGAIGLDHCNCSKELYGKVLKHNEL